MKRLDRRLLACVWGAALVSVFIVYGALIGPQKHALEALASQARALYEEGNQNDETIAEGPRIREARRRVHAEILSLAGQSGTSEPGSLVESVGRQSERWNVRVVSLSPEVSGRDNADRSALRSQDTAIELRGEFPALLGMIASFTSSDNLIDIDAVTFAVSSDATLGRPMLDASIGARVYGLAARWEGKNGVAPSSAPR